MDATFGSPEAGDDMGMELEAGAESSDTTRTALLPTDFFEGKELKPGTECKVRIERVLEGQVEVTYVPHESETEPEIGEAPEAGGDEEMAGYMNE